MIKEEPETFVDLLKKRLEELEQEQKIIEEAKEQQRKYCNHVFGPVTWTWCCGGYRTCKICGMRENYYERD